MYPLSSEGYDDGGGWGRPGILGDLLANNLLVPVLVGDGSGSKLLPREVQLIFSYYQVSTKKKRLVYSYIHFHRLCTTDTSLEVQARLGAQNPPIKPCDTNDRNYTMQFTLDV